jgi:hypothetical protein
MPAPGAAFATTSTLPNMMYHLEISCGESPDLATVKDTPSLPYVGLPCDVKLSEEDFKSMLTVRPRAESGGQSLRSVGLQFDHVWASEGAMSVAADASAASDRMAERIANVW